MIKVCNLKYRFRVRVRVRVMVIRETLTLTLKVRNTPRGIVGKYARNMVK